VTDDAPPCDDCGRILPVMVAMEPGPDGKPWRRCSVCHNEGLRPMNARAA
jgi:hypothetical protein